MHSYSEEEEWEEDLEEEEEDEEWWSNGEDARAHTEELWSQVCWWNKTKSIWKEKIVKEEESREDTRKEKACVGGTDSMRRQ